MDDEEREHYTKLFRFTFGISLDVLHLYFEIKILDKEEFFVFLDRCKHIMFHALHPAESCCECRSGSTVLSNPPARLYPNQFNLLFKSENPTIWCHHKIAENNETNQHCLCNYSASRSVNVDNLDISLVYAIINVCCSSIHGNPQWIKDVKDTRNFLAHKSNCQLTKIEYNTWLTTVENATLDLAKVVGSKLWKMTQKQISDFKKDVLPSNAVQDILASSNDDVCKRFESLLGKLELVSQESKSTKREIIDLMKKHKDELSIDINELNFVVKTRFSEQMSSQKITEESAESGYATSTPQTAQQQSTQSKNENKCCVEWKLATPDTWNVSEIKNTLHKFSSLLKQWFEIEFVYIGSLVIRTIVPEHILSNYDEFKSAVRSFLAKIVEICQLDTDTPTVVKVILSVFPVIPPSEISTNVNNEHNESTLTSPRHYCKEELDCDNCTTNGRIELPVSTEKLSISDITKEGIPEEETEKRSYCDQQSSLKLESDVSESEMFYIPVLYMCKPCLAVERQMMADVWCKECDEFLCLLCAEKHKTMPSNQTYHILTNIHKIQNILSLQSLCSMHQHSELRYICIDHNVLCCMGCVSDIHRICEKVMPLDQATKWQQEQQQDHAERINNNLDILIKLRETRMENKNTIADDSFKIRDEITKCIEDIQNQGATVENEKSVATSLIIELNKVKEKQLEEIELDIDEIHYLVNLAKQQKEMFDFVNEHGSTNQRVLLICTSHYSLGIDYIHDRIAKMSNTLYINLHFKKSTYKDVNFAGIIEVVKTTNKITENQTQCFIENTFSSFTFHCSINLRGTRLTGMSFSDSKLLLLCDSGSPRILIYNDNGDYQGHIQTLHVPWDITMIPGRNLAVITSHAENCIQFVDIFGKKVIKTQDVKHSRQRGIASSSQSIFIGGKKQIHILDHEGFPIRTIEILNSRGCIWYLSYINDKICFNDGSETLRCINMKNTTVFTYCSASLQVQRQMTMDIKGNVYIVGNKSNNIHRLSHDGKFIDEILNAGDGLKNPLAICFNRDYSMLYVANYGGDIMAFKIGQ